MVKKKQKIVLPPELPPEVPDEEVEVSDEDLQFVNENLDYAGFVSKLDTRSITKHITRVADASEGVLESLYEKRRAKRAERGEKEESQVEVDPVDALPVKTLDGQLYYRRVLKEKKEIDEEPKGDEPEDGESGLVKPTKAEKRAKFKKLKKEAKKQAKEEEVEQQATSQAAVLDEVKKDLCAEEESEKKKYKIAELGTALLADPEANIKLLKEMLEITKDGNPSIVTLALKSLLAVFKDIIPGYRIRLPTEKELEAKVSKTVKKMRFYESTLLSAYKAYIQKLLALQKHTGYNRVAFRCLCTLLQAVPHFNLRENLMAAVVKNICSEDEVIRKLCCAAVKSLFSNEDKHGGEATLEVVKMIADIVKAHNCLLHPDSVEVLLSLSFDEDLRKRENSEVDRKGRNKNAKKRKVVDEPTPMPDNKWKKFKKEMTSKTREEVTAEYKAASLAQDPIERKKMQTETLSAVFQIFFRILKHAIQPVSEASYTPSAYGDHPLLAPCLNGIGKFSHLLDVDFMADLMKCLRTLASNGIQAGDESKNSCRLSVSERMSCCVIAFRVMKSNLDALNVDLQEFYVQFYNLILEYRSERDQGEVLAEALKVMLCDDRQHDMQRAAAFIKRLASFALCTESAESMAALVTVKHLLQKNVKCRNLLENDAGGGSVAGAIAKYHPYATDPNLSGALSSVLWELNLLTRHYHPSVSSIASSILTMVTSQNQVVHTYVSPIQAYKEVSQQNEASFIPPKDTNKKANAKKRKASAEAPLKLVSETDVMSQIDEDKVRSKLSEHYLLLRNIQENERLRSELDRTTKSLNLYQRYKKLKKKI